MLRRSSNLKGLLSNQKQRKGNQIKHLCVGGMHYLDLAVAGAIRVIWQVQDKRIHNQSSKPNRTVLR